MPWSNEGDESTPYFAAFDTDEHAHTHHVDDGTVPYFSTAAPPAPRSNKLCIGEGHTCKGWKAKGTNLCMGHLKRQAKAQRETREWAALEPLKIADGMRRAYERAMA